MNKTGQDILKTLAYFDYFKYPLTCEDIRTFLPQQCNQSVIDEMLSVLLNENIIFKTDNFYSLQNEPLLAKKRQEGNQTGCETISHCKKSGPAAQPFSLCTKQ